MPVNGYDHRARRREMVAHAAGPQGGVLAPHQLFPLGVTRAEERAEVRAGRWQRVGNHSLQVAPPDHTSAWWRAVFEVGPSAVLDGVSALQAAGLTTITSDLVHIAVPKSAEFRRCRGVRVHETRRYREDDVIRVGLPRMKPATAAVHAALWARTDREAALFVVAAVQQRLVAMDDLAAAIALVIRHKRRRLLRGLLQDVSEGVQSLGERDFAMACRRRGFPPPDRQEMRVLPSGRVYYDVTWARYRVRAEINGAQHLDVVAATLDALKENAASLSGGIVIRIPNHAFRSNPEPFLDQIEEGLSAGGWTGPSVRGFGR